MDACTKPHHYHLPAPSISISPFTSLIIFSFTSPFNISFLIGCFVIIVWMSSRSLEGLFSSDLTSGYRSEIVLTRVHACIWGWTKKKVWLRCRYPGCHSYLKSFIILIIKRSLKSALSDRKKRILWWVVINCWNLKTQLTVLKTAALYNDLQHGDILWSSLHEVWKTSAWSDISFLIDHFHHMGYTFIRGQDQST